MEKEVRTHCEVCNKDSLVEFQISKSPIELESLSSLEFKVTSKDYGRAIETVKCSNCGLVQPKYMLTYKEILKLYENVEDNEYLNSASSRGSSNYSQVVNILNNYKKDGKSVLEIGAGSGTMLKSLSDKYTVEGIEPNTKFCEFAKENYNIDIHNIGYEEFTKTGYDIIIALDVIEHVVSPKDFMSKIHKMLNPNGIAIVGTPDYESLSSKILKSKWYHIRPPHLYYFSVRNMKELIVSSNLSILKVKTFSWALSIGYLFDSVQKLIFKKSFIKLPLGNIKININLRDSKIYIVQK